MSTLSGAGLEGRFAAQWRAHGAPRRLLLAVSGGADSIALLHSASGLRTHGAELRVASVDHGLRAASADEARFVEREAAALGVPSVVLRWEGDKPKTGVQANARAARYRLLAAEAETWRAGAILTGHTADDQAETVMMRMAHRSGVRGLAGMAQETFVADGGSPPQRLLRLLLGERRAALREFLDSIGAAFLDDPSNDDRRFERVRVRRVLQASPRSDEATAGLLALADRARRLAAALDRLDKARLGALGAEFQADGAVTLDAAALSPAIDGALAARLMAAAGGGQAPADSAASEAVAAALAGRRATLAGAIAGREGQRLVLAREPAAIFGRKGETGNVAIPVTPGARLLWDRRFIVRNTLGAAADVRPVGAAAKLLTTERAEALAAAPGLWMGPNLAAYPGDDGPGETAIQCLVAERFHRLAVRH